MDPLKSRWCPAGALGGWAVGSGPEAAAGLDRFRGSSPTKSSLRLPVCYPTLTRIAQVGVPALPAEGRNADPSVTAHLWVPVRMRWNQQDGCCWPTAPHAKPRMHRNHPPLWPDVWVLWSWSPSRQVFGPLTDRRPWQGPHATLLSNWVALPSCMCGLISSPILQSRLLT